MSPKNDIIQILTKCTANIPLTIQESELLEAWKVESDENAKLLEDLTNESYKSTNFKVFSNIDVDQEWEELKTKFSTVEPKKTSIIRRLLPYAAAACLGLIAYTTFNYYNGGTETQSIVTKESKQLFDVNAATQGATLTLANGETIALNQQTAIEDQKGLSLTASKNELTIESNADLIANPSALNVMTVPKGAFYTIILADNTKVWINANSKLTFPTAFDKKQRRVKLEGEAYFDVSHDPTRPFFVETNNTEIKVLGTQFNVNAYEERVKTTLQQGKVEFVASGQKVSLSPGQYAEWNGNNFKQGVANINKDLAWKNKEFRFENDDIVHIAFELSRWYDVQIKFTGDIDMKKEYSGNMSRELSLSKVLKVLQFGSDFDFEIRDKELIIKNK